MYVSFCADIDSSESFCDLFNVLGATTSDTDINFFCLKVGGGGFMRLFVPNFLFRYSK